MNDAATSLDRLHDIVEPPPVPWWPLAPGWYVLALVVTVVVSFWLFKAIRRYRRNAYRRVAVKSVLQAESPQMISETLRRTALVIASRDEIANLVGEAWPLWLSQSMGTPMPADVQRQLIDGPYAPTNDKSDLGPLRAYAVSWIQQHPACVPDRSGDHSRGSA